MEHLSCQVETYRDVIDDIKPLLYRHWQEIALNQESVPLAPNWRRYEEMEKAGALSIVTVRCNGALVGYSVFFVMPGLHYTTILEARMDIFWLAQEHRGRMGGARLFRAHERELRRRGVKRVYVGSKLHKDSSRLFEALGYKPIEQWFSKMLGEET